MYARRLTAPEVPDVDASPIPRDCQTDGVLPEVPHPASDPMKSRRPGPSGGIAVRLAASTVAEAPPPDPPSAEDANTRARDPALCVPPPARLRRHSRAATLNRCDIALLRCGREVDERARGTSDDEVNFHADGGSHIFFQSTRLRAAGAGSLHLVQLNITFGA